MYRQGDVLLIPCKILPKAQVVSESLAVAGENQHTHVLHAPVLAHKNRRFVVLDAPRVMYHDEHPPLVLPPGVYEVRVQRQHTRQAVD